MFAGRPASTKARSVRRGSPSSYWATASSRRAREHTAACRWLAKGLDLRAIQLLLGHADLKTTQRYLNVTDEELRKTMQEKLWRRGSAN